jgi:hypothetical protein
MEKNKFRVGEVCVSTAGNYKTRLIQKLLINDNVIYIFDDVDSSYIRTYQEDNLTDTIISVEEFYKSKLVKVEELTISEIEEKLGKKIKVVKEKINSEDVPF